MKNKYYIYKNENVSLQLLEKINFFCNSFELKETKNADEADLIISIGGDGTFLEAAKQSIGTPIFGINKGTLGYLTEVDEAKFNTTIAQFVNNNYQINKRMMLDAYINGMNKSLVALNDVVVAKSGTSVIGFDVFVDGVLITSYFADGVIISTPTGSTGYSLSCGGPIVDPNSENIIITPIAPHTVINRSIVLSSESIISIKLKRIRNKEKKASLMIDGNEFDMYENDMLTVFKSKEYTNIISFNGTNFLQKIQQKMR